jgi:hypothetical protein
MIIIVIVVIIGIVFLGIYLRGDKSIVKEDAELRNFLTASMRYTSDCFKTNDPSQYRTLEDLSGECYQKARVTCIDGERTSCDVLNSTFSWMLRRFWPSGVDRPVKYTRMTLDYRQNSTEEGNVFMRINQGNESGCMVIKSAEEAISLDQGNVIVKIEICTGN